MAQSVVLLWLGAGVLLAGAVGAVVVGLRRAPATRPFHWLVAVAGGVLGIAYAATALDVGTVSVAVGTTDTTVSLVRYAAWLVAGPALLGALWLLAGGTRATLGVLIGLAGFAFGLAVAATLTTDPLVGLTVERTRLALWGGVVVLVLALVGVVLRVLSPQAGRQPRAVAIRFSILRNLLVLVALLFPLAWVVGPPGLGLVGNQGGTAIGLVLDVVAVLGIGGLLLKDAAILGAGRGDR